MSRLIIDENPLLVLPKLAEKIGLNEAIFLQQLHYWLAKGKKIQGKSWVYNSYEQWLIQFPFWSLTTIRRIINNLEKSEIIVTGNFNKAGFDKTKWYTINYEKLISLERNQQIDVSNLDRRCDQNEQMEVSILNRPIPETTHKTTTETTYKDIVLYLNQKANKNYSDKSKKTQTLIKARLNEGFTESDFKKVIDNKCSEWLHDTKMNQYLRPETLFGTKFESYLNMEVKKGGRNSNSTGEDFEYIGI